MGRSVAPRAADVKGFFLGAGGIPRRACPLKALTGYLFPQMREAVADDRRHALAARFKELVVLHMLPICRERMPIAHLHDFIRGEAFSVPVEVFGRGAVGDIDVV